MITRKVLVILGSTSTGKTDLALKIAEKFNGELVSCDSRQIYKGLDIGTGKLPDKGVVVTRNQGFWEMNEIRIWMHDVVDPKRQYSVADYVKDANKAIDGILRREKLLVIVGGTGLYLKALLEGLPNLVIPVDKDLRKELQELSKEQLQKRIQQIAPDRWKNLNESDRQNPRRLVRAIELCTSLQGIKQPRVKLKGGLAIQSDVLKIGLIAPREILYKRIDKRVVSRINQGMIEETKSLHKAGLSLKRMKQLGLEYGVLADYLEGQIKNKEELVQVLQGKIHRFARRQLTWFKKEKDVYWFDITNKKFSENVENVVEQWYDQV